MWDTATFKTFKLNEFLKTIPLSVLESKFLTNCRYNRRSEQRSFTCGLKSKPAGTSGMTSMYSYVTSKLLIVMVLWFDTDTDCW